MSRKVCISDGTLALVLALPDLGMPEFVAFGPDAEEAERIGERASRENGMDVDAPAARLLPTGGMGAFGWPAIAGHRDGRDSVIAFGGWRVEGEGAKVVLRARDEVARLGVAVELSITVGALSIVTTLANQGDGVFTLDRCMAGGMIVPEGPAEITSFGGGWGREFQIRREPLTARLWMQESRRGRTSHDRSPSILVTGPGASLAAHLGWSGNHVIAVEELDDGRRLAHLGELFEPGEMRLDPGAAYQSPTAFFAPDPAALRARLKASMRWPAGALTPRPVTLNTWEGNSFAHRLPHLMRQAEAAAELGVERFVLDDGWFGRRDSDASSLGDWTVDARKYPDGLKPLADRAHALGMQFGLWFEPEMVSPDSDLHRAHPDWALSADGRRAPLSRKQLVLDLTRPEAFEHVFQAVDRILSSAPIDCVKWDMNRDLAPPTDAAGRARTAAQTRAVYALMDRIRAARPALEIEFLRLRGRARGLRRARANAPLLGVGLHRPARAARDPARGAAVFPARNHRRARLGLAQPSDPPGLEPRFPLPRRLRLPFRRRTRSAGTRRRRAREAESLDRPAQAATPDPSRRPPVRSRSAGRTLCVGRFNAGDDHRDHRTGAADDDRAAAAAAPAGGRRGRRRLARCFDLSRIARLCSRFRRPAATARRRDAISCAEFSRTPVCRCRCSGHRAGS